MQRKKITPFHVMNSLLLGLLCDPLSAAHRTCHCIISF